MLARGVSEQSEVSEIGGRNSDPPLMPAPKGIDFTRTIPEPNQIEEGI